MELFETAVYSAYGLDADQQRRLGVLGDLILQTGLNVSGIKDPLAIERFHFLDSLSLLRLDEVSRAARIADVGSGGGLPGLVLALAMPGAHITAIESQRKKCQHIAHAVETLDLANVSVCCSRVEDHGRAAGREAYDVAVSRAVASLAVVAEYSLPLVRLGGVMVAMKGHLSEQELAQASRALGILGADVLEVVRLAPFKGSRDRSACLAKKVRTTPNAYPRRAGMPGKRPLGQPDTERPGEARP